MTLILALETSADICAAALVEDGDILGVRQAAMSRGHAEALVPMVQELAGTAGIALTNVDLIGVTRGPGSFTGVRTGIAAARGFAIASGATAIGVSSLQAVARGVVGGGAASPHPVLCVLETRRADFFAQIFGSDGAPHGAPEVMTAQDLFLLIGSMQPVLAGNAVDRLLSSYDGDPGLLRRDPGSGNPHPVDVAALARTIFEKQGVAPDTLSPLYLRVPEAKIPVNGGRLKQ